MECDSWGVEWRGSGSVECRAGGAAAAAAAAGSRTPGTQKGRIFASTESAQTTGVRANWNVFWPGSSARPPACPCPRRWPPPSCTPLLCHNPRATSVALQVTEMCIFIGVMCLWAAYLLAYFTIRRWGDKVPTPYRKRMVVVNLWSTAMQTREVWARVSRMCLGGGRLWLLLAPGSPGGVAPTQPALPF